MEEIHDDGSPTDKTFEHVPTEIGAEEAEEVRILNLNIYSDAPKFVLREIFY